MEQQKRALSIFKRISFRDHPEIGMLIPLIIIMGLTQLVNHNFLSFTNMTAMLKSIPFIALASLGSSLPLITGNVDISIGRIAGLSGMIFGLTYTVYGFGLFPAILLGLFVGLIVGIINGVLVVYVKVTSFIVTMGTLYICGGLRYLINHGTVMTLNETIRDFATQTPLGVSWPFWIVVIIFVMIGFMQRKLAFGRYLYAVGSNKEVAQLQGVNVKRVELIAYLISGVFAAASGVLATMDINSAQPSTGTMWEFKAVAACVVGGASLTGGVGSALGVGIGVFIVFVIDNIINMISLSNYWSDAFTGAILLGAVLIDLFRQRRKIKG